VKASIAKRHVVELLGMLLVLLSAGYQVFFATSSQSLANDEALLDVRQKVDTIWDYIGNYSQLPSETENDSVARQQLHGDLNKQFFQFDKAHTWQTIATVDSQIAGAMFCLGSILLLLSRYEELTHKSGGNELSENRRPPAPSLKRRRRKV